MSAPRILFCSVGGSPAPILSAIAELSPDQVIFVCSTTDLATGKAGTRASAVDIAAQVCLADSHYAILEIPTDDLDAAHAALTTRVARLRREIPDAELLADYTGGTKTMSAALVCVALENDIQLCLTTGPRTDHQRVTRGQDTAAVSPEGIHLRRSLAHVAQLWQRYAYAEAAALLQTLPRPQDLHLRGTLQRQRDLSLAFAAWDDFDHLSAASLLTNYTPMLGKALAPYSGLLTVLNKAAHRHSEPLQILDLWHNAARRAAQGRHDDAVARLYRLLEWSAQWLLKTYLKIETSDVPAALIPPDIAIQPAHDGRRSAGLFAAWALLAHHRPDAPAGQLFRSERGILLNHLHCRNQSILAHGFTPITVADWQVMADWVDARLIPVILAESALNSLSPQLPARLFEAPVAAGQSLPALSLT